MKVTWQGTGHFDNANGVESAKGVFTRQLHDEVQRLVRHLGEGVRGVQHHGQQQGANFSVEQAVDPGPLRGGAFAVRDHINAVLGQGWRQGLVPDGVLPGHQFMRGSRKQRGTAADVLAKLLTVDGSGSGLDADLLDGQHASAFATAAHNHNTAYLGISAKAVDADKLDGYDSSAFVRSVNGGGPDASGNATVNVDLSSRVTKSGDTMTGRLTLPSATISSTAPQIDFTDTDQGTTRYLHVNGNLMGFLNTGGGWDLYANNSGQVWAANYGWLHDYFFRQVANCAANPGTGDNAINCYGGGNINSGRIHEVIDEGGQIRLRSVNYLTNCNCNCNCCGC